MIFNISKEEKIQMAENSISALEEIKKEIIRSAERDPDSFVVGQISDDNSIELNNLYEEINKINIKINNIKNLIQEL